MQIYINVSVLEIDRTESRKGPRTLLLLRDNLALVLRCELNIHAKFNFNPHDPQMCLLQRGQKGLLT